MFYSVWYLFFVLIWFLFCYIWFLCFVFFLSCLFFVLFCIILFFCVLFFSCFCVVFCVLFLFYLFYLFLSFLCYFVSLCFVLFCFASVTREIGKNIMQTTFRIHFSACLFINLHISFALNKACANKQHYQWAQFIFTEFPRYISSYLRSDLFINCIYAKTLL